MDTLPVVNEETGEVKNISRNVKGKTPEELVNMVKIEAAVVDGRKNIAYIVKTYGGKEVRLGRGELLIQAKKGNVVNARVQNYNGQLILKGVNCNLSDLPKIDVNQAR